VEGGADGYGGSIPGPGTALPGYHMPPLRGWGAGNALSAESVAIGGDPGAA